MRFVLETIAVLAGSVTYGLVLLVVAGRFFWGCFLGAVVSASTLVWHSHGYSVGALMAALSMSCGGIANLGACSGSLVSCFGLGFLLGVPSTLVALTLCTMKEGSVLKSWELVVRSFFATNNDEDDSSDDTQDDDDSIDDDDACFVARYRRRAQQGNREAMFSLAVCYEKGIALEKKDWTTAASWYRKSAEAGNPLGMFYWSLCLEEGRGAKKNLKVSAKWCLRAAECGDVEAQYKVGVLHERNGNSVEAAMFFRKAAEAGIAGAQFKMGTCCEGGRGVKKDLVEAASWYRKASKHNHLGGMLCLGRCLEYGRGVERDLVEAASWFRRAAEGGDADAMKALASFYETGRGVEKDPKEASSWRQKASLIQKGQKVK